MLSHYKSPEHLQSLAAERVSILKPKPVTMPEVLAPVAWESQDEVAPKRFQTKEVAPRRRLGQKAF